MENFKFQTSRPEVKAHRAEKGERLTSNEKMRSVMARISQEVNREAQEKYGLGGLVNESLHIDPTYFSREKGGIYEEADIIDDKETVNALDRYNCAADNANTQKFYKDQYGIETPEGIVAKHLEKKEASKSNQAEIVITALLHKVLKDRFLVVRASVFDDYKHGIDNLILDKETGAVICAFDEVLENQGDRERGAVKKIEKIKKSAIRGGTEAKYGISLKEGQLTRAHTRNIPVFYLTLESKDLNELTDDLYNNEEMATEAESRLFAHLVGSIKEQKEMLGKLNLPPVMRRRLEGFESSLKTLEGFTAQTSVGE